MNEEEITALYKRIVGRYQGYVEVLWPRWRKATEDYVLVVKLGNLPEPVEVLSEKDWKQSYEPSVALLKSWWEEPGDTRVSFIER